MDKPAVVQKEKKDSTLEKIKELEEQISKTKYNKKTQHAIGLYKAQVAKLKEKQRARSKGKKGEGYAVRKTGDGTVVLLGFPSVGKSTLLNALTNADSPVGTYAFTTLTVIPGILNYKYAKIQVLDVPGVVRGAAAGTGRGKEVLAVIRNADLILFLIDVFHPEHFDVLKKEVYDADVRINQKFPDVKIIKTARGGINIGTTVRLTKIGKKTAEDILKEFKINNANVVIREDINADQMIDVIEGNKAYLPAIVVLNKIDMVGKEELNNIKNKIKPDLCVSAEKNIGVEDLKELIYKKLKIIRIYLKEFNKKADMEEPLIMWQGCTLKDLCLKLHKDFVDKFKFAKVWGHSSKFPGQKIVKLDHVLQDKDIVELRMN
ncbi:MAG: GTP-binding protein [Candidatus Woesearchaeota archaeon]|nr:GTP-binding protein [Candidatus Woesearchaeota archaeon]MDP6265572.1 GTP-binding protein [Candidatus Woesearchaeota archaeon]MDP7322393.1 GTP-binding protein [Candidatus Woesearchaeota archaeon]MDP7476672.1 GTP-binding protein [Candidatus Woesearchaeota archaeon]